MLMLTGQLSVGTSGGEKEEEITGRQKRGGGGGQILLADGTSGSPGTKNKTRPAGVCVCSWNKLTKCTDHKAVSYSFFLIL